MQQNISRFLISSLSYYIVDFISRYFLILPDCSLISLSSFIPPILGIMWGPIAAYGSMIGALLAEYSDWLIIPTIFKEKGISACLWQSVLLFCNCGFWAFISAYMPWRLGYSLFVSQDNPLFSLRMHIILKFVWLMFITTLTTSLFLAMTTDEADMFRKVNGLTINLGISGEYALTCFLNDFGSSIFSGLIAFFFLVSYNYPFYRPKDNVNIVKPEVYLAFDMTFVIGIIMALFFCQPHMIEYEGFRLFAGFFLCIYLFRPLAPFPNENVEKENIMHQDDIKASGRIAAMFYAFFILLHLVMDSFGTIYGLDDMNTWRQFNVECITMMNIALVALLCMLLHYHNSIMKNVVMLEVLTVFVSAFVLGGISFMITDKIMTQKVNDSIEEMSIICRERLERTFDNIQISVNDIHDLALTELEDYNLLVNDENWRQNYLKKTEYLFNAIASNTDGSVAFYFRLSPDYAGPLGGFSFSREKNRWEGVVPSFNRRSPIDLSKYDSKDISNVGWYYIPVERRNPTWIEPYIDPTFQTYVISYVSPIYFENKLVGVVGMDIDFEFLIHEIRRMTVYDYGFVYLIDRHNRVLYHKDYKQGEIFSKNEDFQEKETYLTNGIWIGIAVPLSYVYNERNNLLMYIVCIMLIVTIIASYLSIYLASRGIKPLMFLTEAAQKIANGNLDVQLPLESRNELGTLVKSIREMVSKLEIYVYHDKLTGLRNTTSYARKCYEISERTEGNNMPYAVIVFDVNFLKKINDTYGHEAGNELIKTAANIIRNIFNKSPVFRIGGDEFVTILEGDEYEQRDKLIEKFDEAIAKKTITVKDKSFMLSVARGIGIWRENADYAAVFREADNAMYGHKADIKKKLGINSR